MRMRNYLVTTTMVVNPTVTLIYTYFEYYPLQVGKRY